jgi:hypothetical protein
MLASLHCGWQQWPGEASMHRYIGRMVDDNRDSRIIDIDTERDGSRYTTTVTTKEKETFHGFSSTSANDSLFEAIEKWESHYDSDLSYEFYETKVTEQDRARWEISRLQNSLQFNSNLGKPFWFFAYFGPFTHIYIAFWLLGRLNSYELGRNDYFLVQLVPGINWLYVAIAPFFVYVPTHMKEALAVFWILVIVTTGLLVIWTRAKISRKRPKAERRIAELRQFLASSN